MPTGRPNPPHPADLEPGLEKDAPPLDTATAESILQQLSEFKQALDAERDRNRTLASELAENKRRVELMMENGDGLDLLAIETRWRMREEARRRIYRHVAGKKVIIRLHNEKDAMKNFPVHVNLNGKFYNIPRGKPFEIEGEFLEVLDHAEQRSLSREVVDGNPHTVLIDSLQYPYVVLRGLEDMDNATVMEAAA